MAVTGILLVILRLVHIVAGVAWFGLGATQVVFVEPALRQDPDTAARFFPALYKKTPFGASFAVLAVLTVIAGILLYVVGDSASRFTTTGDMVLGIGALFGLLAAGHGGAATGRISAQYVEALEQKAAGKTVEGLDELAHKFQLHGRISFVMMFIALVAMGSARYL